MANMTPVEMHEDMYFDELCLMKDIGEIESSIFVYGKKGFLEGDLEAGD